MNSFPHDSIENIIKLLSYDKTIKEYVAQEYKTKYTTEVGQAVN